MISYEEGYFAFNAYFYGEQTQKTSSYGPPIINTQTQQEFLKSTNYDVTKNVSSIITAYGLDNISMRRFEEGFTTAYDEKCQSPEFGDIEEFKVCLNQAMQNILCISEQEYPDKVRLSEAIGELMAHAINLSERQAPGAGLQTVYYFYDWSSFNIVKYALKIFKKLSRQDLIIEKVQEEFFKHVNPERGRSDELWQQLLEEIK